MYTAQWFKEDWHLDMKQSSVLVWAIQGSGETQHRVEKDNDEHTGG